MTDALAPISYKLRAIVKMLSSDRDGEVIGTARALNRLLKAHGSDIHALADRVGQTNGKISEAEMRVLYDAGFKAGMRAAEDKLHGDEDFHNIDGSPPWHAMATFCHRSDRLNARERDFINSVAARTVYREPTEKQAKWLKAIFFRIRAGG